MQNKQKLFFSPKEFFISLPKSFIPLTRQSPPFDTETKERYSGLPPANPRQHIFILLLFVSLLSPRPAAPPRVGPALPVLRAAGRPLWEEAPAELTAGNGRRWRRQGSSQHPFCPFLRTTRCTQRLPVLVVGCFFVVWVVFFFFPLSLSYLSLCIFCYYFLMPGQFFFSFLLLRSLLERTAAYSPAPSRDIPRAQHRASHFGGRMRPPRGSFGPELSWEWDGAGWDGGGK